LAPPCQPDAKADIPADYARIRIGPPFMNEQKRDPDNRNCAAQHKTALSPLSKKNTP